MSAMPNVWVVVLGFNGLDDTLQCLESLARVDDGVPGVVYVDNASADGSADAVASRFPWCHVVRNRTNEGYAGGNNSGIRYALDHGAGYVLVLNNDTVVAPDLLSTLMDTATRYPDHGVIGPVIGFCDEPAVVRTDGCVINHRAEGTFFARQEVPVVTSAAAVHDTEVVNGCCMMIRADVLRAAGMFDERFFLVHEETDLCLRAAKAGFKLGILDRMLVWHKGSSSFKRTGRRLQKYFDVRNLALLLRKQSPFGGVRRGRVPSWIAYGRYAYHQFCVEHEAGEASAATAVIEGLHDAVFWTYGRYEIRRRLLVGPLRRGFLAARALKALASPSAAHADLERRS